MSRRLFIRVVTPAVLVGLFLLAVSLTGAWTVSRLQRNLSGILTENVTSLEAAQELEIQLRQMRYHALLHVIAPSPARWRAVEKDRRQFEAALEQAQRSANLDEEKRLVADIRAGYRVYQATLTRPAALPPRPSPDDYTEWADAHPVRGLVSSCEQLFELNKGLMERSAAESEEVGRRTRLLMLLVGVVGPVGGLLAGVGIARGLGQSIARLRVRVEDVRAQLDEDVGSVRLAAGGGLDHLDSQLERVLGRVREVVGRLNQQQQEMMRAERLAVVGRLAASIAHEVRNPLTSVKLLVGAALRGGTGQALTADDLHVIHGEIERLEQTVQNLLDFARPQPPRREAADLRDCAARALALLRPRARQQGVGVELHQPDAPLAAEVDRGQIHSVLVNLLLNALDAMPEGGTLEVRLEDAPAGPQVRVRDTGPGIPPGGADQIFAEFATTKPGGTGLGLSNSSRIMGQHGGTLTAANHPDGGACFLLTLPARQESGVRSQGESIEARSASEGPRH